MFTLQCNRLIQVVRSLQGLLQHSYTAVDDFQACVGVRLDWEAAVSTVARHGSCSQLSLINDLKRGRTSSVLAYLLSLVSCEAGMLTASYSYEQRAILKLDAMLRQGADIMHC